MCAPKAKYVEKYGICGPSAKTLFVLTLSGSQCWVFRDVVFQDVGFQTTIFAPLTHISFMCEAPTSSVVEGQQSIIFKPRILKHHIPELPTFLRCQWPEITLNWVASLV